MITPTAARSIRWAATWLLLLLSFTVGGVATPLTGPMPVASAACATGTFSGTWNNTAANPTGIVKAQLRFVCSGSTGSYQLRLFGACFPTACDWGWTGTSVTATLGFIELFASYDQGFARRSVFILPVDDSLWITVDTTFQDGSGRAPYSMSGTFRR